MSDNSTNTAAPMRLRAAPPRVTRLSRKVLASVAAVTLIGIGGSLIYALQTRNAGKEGEEATKHLFSAQGSRASRRRSPHLSHRS